MDKRLYVAETDCKRLDVFLSEQTDEFTRSRIKKLIEEGFVCVNGVPVKKAGESVKTGDGVEVFLPDVTPYAVEPENIPVDIVYQDGDLAVINKAQGMTVHAGNGNEKGTLVNALLYALDGLSGVGGVLRPGIVHRIDKDTTGLLVVAKNDKAHVSLAKQIAEKTCRREYYALLEGNLKTDEGRVVTEIGRHPTDRVKMAVLENGKGKLAVTDYRVIARFGADFTFCKFILQTGRTHQIRVHAKHLGHPVAGDTVYGYKKQKVKADGQLLHAYKLSFVHPTSGAQVSFNAPLPTQYKEILSKLCTRYGVENEEIKGILE